MSVFERACVGNELNAAAEVLTVLETWHEGRTAKYGRERRIDDRRLVAMRTEMERFGGLAHSDLSSFRAYLLRFEGYISETLSKTEGIAPCATRYCYFPSQRSVWLPVSRRSPLGP